MSQIKSGNGQFLVRASVAAILGSTVLFSYAPQSSAAEAQAAADDEETKELAEVTVTGSRILRRDTVSNSPLVTVDRQTFEDSTFTSIEQVLNEMPEFMAGGPGATSAAVTSLTEANNLAGGQGAGTMFNMAMLPDNGRVGQSLPGVATVNLRGLGVNRNLVLVDGHRGVPSTANGVMDLNNIPQSAIASAEVISGGASAVYGADALAGVTNVKLRDNFEGVSIRVRGGINEVGDGGEYQVSTLMGTRFAGKGSAMVGIEYSKRDATYWKNRDFFREVMESPFSGSGTFAFNWEPYYSTGGLGSATSNTALGASGATLVSGFYTGNRPSQAAINQVFGDRTCRDPANQALVSCIGTNGAGAGAFGAFVPAGFYFNDDDTLYTRGSSASISGVNYQWGPQGWNATIGPDAANPSKVTCNFTTSAVVSQYPGLEGEQCITGTGRVDWGRTLTSPRDAYNLFGRATYELTDNLTAFSTITFSASDTQTRREPAPFLGGFSVAIPFHQSVNGADVRYLPSVVQVPRPGQSVGDTLPEYRVGGARGTNCPDVGGCTISQAFPVPAELRTLLESRGTINYGTTGLNATNPFRGLSACNLYTVASNPSAVGVRTNPTSGVAYVTTMDPNTGQPLDICGANSAWRLNAQLSYLPPRGTINTGRTFHWSGGLRGDLGLSDWTWELYTSYGDSRTQTSYVGFASYSNYNTIITAPNYGRGLVIEGNAQKTLSCTSGLDPFDVNLVPSADCIEAVQSNQIDRNVMVQRVHELSTQGHLFELPAGEVRGALGATYRKNSYSFTPDSLRERDYIVDTSPGQFGVGNVDESVNVKEVYGEMLVPLLKDLPLIRSLELELGARHSKYSTGQSVQTWKALASWAPLSRVRFRGGYNRAERAPNISELFASPSASSQFSGAATDPCRSDPNLATLFGGAANYNTATNPNRALLQALCSANINAAGGNDASDFHQDPNAFNTQSGLALVVGNPDLKSERGDTWTVGMAFTSPFEHALLRRITGTVDWYEARVSDPIEVLGAQTIVSSCFNVNGLNPTYSLDDPLGYCALVERDPVDGGIQRTYTAFGNQGKLVIRGLDLQLRWAASLADMGMGNAPGTLSVNINGNYLIDQIQRYAPTNTDDYAGFGGASKIRASSGVSYNWGRGHRVSLNWNYRLGTDTPTSYAVTASATGATGPDLKRNPLLAGFSTTNTFSATAATQIGGVNVSLSINNLLDTKPTPASYDFRDPRAGFGSFSPFGDLIGRRYSLNLSMDL